MASDQHDPGIAVPPKSVITRLANAAWETTLGISTRGVAPVEHDDSYHYATMSFSAIRTVLRPLSLGTDDTFVDIGCGKGRVLAVVARQRLRAVIGVEFDAGCTAIAGHNARRLRGRKTPIAVHQGDAKEFDYGDGTAFFLFNPFGAKTLDTVLRKIRTDTGNRPIRIAYANPLHDDVFAAHPWLTRFATFTERDGADHPASFYRSTP